MTKIPLKFSDGSEGTIDGPVTQKEKDDLEKYNKKLFKKVKNMFKMMGVDITKDNCFDEKDKKTK